MDVKKQVKSFLSQAEVYKSQGLLKEARDRYIDAGKMIEKNKKLISNHASLLNAISKKINILKSEIKKLDEEPLSKEMPEQIQEIIKKKFAFSQDKDTAELEGAIALAKFGQYEKALEEFKALLKKENTSLEAAKNIIRCHIGLDTIMDAVNHYQNWASSSFFNSEQLNSLRRLLQNILDKKGLDISLLVPDEEAGEPDIAEGEIAPGLSEEEILDISSVGITLNEGPCKGQTHEYDVSFQSGTVINLLISSREKDLLESLKEGLILDNVQFYSPIAMFEGQAVVASKSQIEAGPKQGNYSVDIKIQSI